METQRLTSFAVESQLLACYAAQFIAIDSVFASLSTVAWLHSMLLISKKAMLLSLLDVELYKNQWLKLADFYKMSKPVDENQDGSDTEDDSDDDDDEDMDDDDDDDLSGDEDNDEEDSDDEEEDSDEDDVDGNGDSDDDDDDDDDNDDDDDTDDDDDDDDEEDDEDTPPSKKFI